MIDAGSEEHVWRAAGAGAGQVRARICALTMILHRLARFVAACVNISPAHMR